VKLAREFYSLRWTLKRLQRGKAEPAKRIPSNSEPWVENPRTLEDVETIIDGIAETLKQFPRERALYGVYPGWPKHGGSDDARGLLLQVRRSLSDSKLNATESPKWRGSQSDRSSFFGLFTRGEISHIRI
jgi:hypothetical protein